MSRVLKDITISEVSSVDRGAGRGVKVLLMKRDDGAEPYWKRDFTQEQRDAAASSGAALPDGSFPLKNEQDLKNAIRLAGKASDPAKAKSHIKTRASALGLTDLIPDTWKRDSGDLEMTKEELDKLVADAVTAGITKALEEPAKLLKKQAEEISLLKMTDAQKAYMAGCDEATKKKFTDTPSDERDGFMQKNPLVKRDAPVDQAELQKRDTQIVDLRTSNAEMKKRLDTIDLEKAVEDFKKRAVTAGLDEADGETMRKAYGGDAEAQKTLDKRHAEVRAALQKQVETGVLFGEFGTNKAVTGSAMGMLNAKADELRKTEAGAKLTREQAFAKVYEDPANSELAAQEKAERSKRLTVVAA